MRSQFFISEIISGVDVLSKNYYNLQYESYIILCL